MALEVLGGLLAEHELKKDDKKLKSAKCEKIKTEWKAIGTIQRGQTFEQAIDVGITLGVDFSAEIGANFEAISEKIGVKLSATYENKTTTTIKLNTDGDGYIAPKYTIYQKVVKGNLIRIFTTGDTEQPPFTIGLEVWKFDPPKNKK
eukprot:238350_1